MRCSTIGAFSPAFNPLMMTSDRFGMDITVKPGAFADRQRLNRSRLTTWRREALELWASKCAPDVTEQHS